MKKVLLVQPNYRGVYSYAGSSAVTPIFPPFGLAYIAAVLRKHKVPIRILEANALNLSYEEVEQAIKNYNPDILGITSTTALFNEAKKIAKIAKDAGVKTIIVGGVHSSSLPSETLQECKEIDIACRGEGEYTLLELAQGKKLEKIKGISYRQGKKIKHNIPRELIQNLDALPFPARDMLPMDKYYSFGAKRQPSDYILSSRGCPYSCVFCADWLVHGKKFRVRSAENIVTEIEMLIDKYKIKEFDFIDDNFTLIYERVEKICNLMIKKSMHKKVIWRCSNGVRIDRLTFELLKKMKDAGCYMLSLGIESGNEKILRNIKKGINLKQVRQTVEWCKRLGIEIRGLFMFGNLGENEQTMKDTIKFAKSLDLDTATFHITVPFPMTEYWNIIQKEGKIIKRNWNDFIAYGKVTFLHGSLKPEMLLAMQKRAYREFYMNPIYILRKISKVRTLKDILSIFKGALSIIKI